MTGLIGAKDERPTIAIYLSDPSISSEESEAMRKAYDDACHVLKSSGRKFSTRAVATVIDNFAHDGEHNAARLVDAVIDALSPKTL